MSPEPGLPPALRELIDLLGQVAVDQFLAEADCGEEGQCEGVSSRNREKNAATGAGIPMAAQRKGTCDAREISTAAQPEQEATGRALQRSGPIRKL